MQRKIRCKFVTGYVTNHEDGTVSVTASAVTADTPENAEYWKYTPAGFLSLPGVTARVAEVLTPGKVFYLDITPVE
jgi:acylphosphatase